MPRNEVEFALGEVVDAQIRLNAVERDIVYADVVSDRMLDAHEYAVYTLHDHDLYLDAVMDEVWGETFCTFADANPVVPDVEIDVPGTEDSDVYRFSLLYQIAHSHGAVRLCSACKSAQPEGCGACRDYEESCD